MIRIIFGIPCSDQFEIDPKVTYPKSSCGSDGAEGEIRTPEVQSTTSSQGWRLRPDLATSAFGENSTPISILLGNPSNLIGSKRP